MDQQQIPMDQYTQTGTRPHHHLICQLSLFSFVLSIFIAVGMGSRLTGEEFRDTISNS